MYVRMYYLVLYICNSFGDGVTTHLIFVLNEVWWDYSRDNKLWLENTKRELTSCRNSIFTWIYYFCLNYSYERVIVILILIFSFIHFFFSERQYVRTYIYQFLFNWLTKWPIYLNVFNYVHICMSQVFTLLCSYVLFFRTRTIVFRLSVNRIYFQIYSPDIA